VIQRATKETLARFAAENIFQPLGMLHTLFTMTTRWPRRSASLLITQAKQQFLARLVNHVRPGRRWWVDEQSR
jgi:Beta-lactamase.